MSFNAIGTVMFMTAFGAGYGISQAIGGSNEGLWMMCAGPLLAVFDLGVRRVRGVPLVRGAGAGTMLFVPAWLWGTFWTALGAVYYWRDP